METMIEFGVFLLECAFWYFVINLVLTPWRRRLEEKNQELEDVIGKLKEVVHIVSVEKHGDCYYWFDAEDGQFLAQGMTEEDTLAHLKSRFPNHIFFVQSKEQSYKVSAPDWKFVPVKINESTADT